MTAPASASAIRAQADHQHLLARQCALEIELIQARQDHRGLKRKNAATAGVAATPVEDAGGEAWMMTYLDMMTLLLVVSMAMLAMAGKGYGHTPHTSADLNPPLSVEALTRLDPPGQLLLVPQLTPPLPEPAAPPVDSASQILPAEIPDATEVAAIEPPATVEAPPVLASEPVPDDPLKGLDLDKLGDDIEVITNQKTIRLRINSEILFPSGQSDLNLGGLSVLQRLIPLLKSVPHQIVVAGHTDTQHMRSSRFPSNWELSGARAGSVVRYLQSNGIPRDRLTAVGYADTRPLGDNSSAQGRARNRRVELILQR